MVKWDFFVNFNSLIMLTKQVCAQVLRANVKNQSCLFSSIMLQVLPKQETDLKGLNFAWIFAAKKSLQHPK